MSSLIRHPAFSFIAILGFAEIIRDKQIKFCDTPSFDTETDSSGKRASYFEGLPANRDVFVVRFVSSARGGGFFSGPAAKRCIR